MYDIETLYEADSVAHAITLLQEHRDALILAGGSDLLIQIREGRLAGCVLVSIQKLDELRGISMDREGTIRIGALTSFSHITRDPIIHQYLGVLGEAVDMIGGPQIRNIGTIGGNVCNGVSSADSASTLMAYDAVMEYAGPQGIRSVPIEDHYVQGGKTALTHDELLTAIRIPQECYEHCYGHYIKYAMRNAMDIAILGCSVNVRITQDKKRIERMRIAYGVAGPVPMRSSSAEAAVKGQRICEKTIDLAGKAALHDMHPRSSWRASKELRLHLIEELAKRALRRSIEIAGGTV
ncbi:MAG: xanthine dehydrogenase FAD-binding subunit XdhB [Treponema sp.]|jgi:xanthine dehydrogenase FAD-binding subunit|nr:xanthine dehydrogenase FAD-binding subunit XdhB [Treponema sp.]